MTIDRERTEDAQGAGVDPSDGWGDVSDDDGARDGTTEEVELLLTDAALGQDDPVTGEAARRGADPDLAVDSPRGEEP